jgi:hypothetical protein
MLIKISEFTPVNPGEKGEKNLKEMFLGFVLLAVMANGATLNNSCAGGFANLPTLGAAPCAGGIQGSTVGLVPTTPSSALGLTGLSDLVGPTPGSPTVGLGLLRPPSPAVTWIPTVVVFTSGSWAYVPGTYWEPFSSQGAACRDGKCGACSWICNGIFNHCKGTR